MNELPERIKAAHKFFEAAYKLNPYARRIAFISNHEEMPDNREDVIYLNIKPLEEIPKGMTFTNYQLDDRVNKDQPLFDEWFSRYIMGSMVSKTKKYKTPLPAKKGEDFYTTEAKRIFKVNHPTHEMRQHVKWLNFTAAYGCLTEKSPFRLPDLRGKFIREEVSSGYKIPTAEDIQNEIAKSVGLPISLLFGEITCESIANRSLMDSNYLEKVRPRFDHGEMNSEEVAAQMTGKQAEMSAMLDKWGQRSMQKKFESMVHGTWAGSEEEQRIYANRTDYENRKDTHHRMKFYSRSTESLNCRYDDERYELERRSKQQRDMERDIDSYLKFRNCRTERMNGNDPEELYEMRRRAHEAQGMLERLERTNNNLERLNGTQTGRYQVGVDLASTEEDKCLMDDLGEVAIRVFPEPPKAIVTDGFRRSLVQTLEVPKMERIDINDFGKKDAETILKKMINGERV